MVLSSGVTETRWVSERGNILAMGAIYQGLVITPCVFPAGRCGQNLFCNFNPPSGIFHRSTKTFTNLKHELVLR